MEVKPIAITGIGCRFPGTNNPQAFWKLLQDGIDMITEVPKSRWNNDEFYHPDATIPNKTNSRWGGFLDQIDEFDPHFFGISPREALTLDPQHRLLMEVAWEALEDALQIPEQLAGSQTGVFVGIGTHDYSVLLWQNPVSDSHATTGTANCIAANRLSYLFDFKGPSLAVDTACSSSLVAVHLACQSLWRGESTLALAGGVNGLLMPTIMVGFSKSGLLSPDGRCKTFDASANGYVRSEGAGMVVLKPLEQALADGDPIYAVIRGSAVNQDGHSNGLSAPDVEAQKALLRQAYKVAGVSPGQVQYIEAHGTGTKVGDAVELQALGKVLAENRPEGEFCAIGSVKTNIGHSETAAGVAGLIKAALILKYRQIPPSLHFQNPNPAVNFEQLPLRVQQQLTPWPNHSDPALVGVSSFGFGGTNAHVVLQANVETRQNLETRHGVSLQGLGTPYLLTISAKTKPALKDLAHRYEVFFRNNSDSSLRDICYCANTRRSQFSHRLTIIADSHQQFQDRLNAFVHDQETSGVRYITTTPKTSPKIAFLFTGQGSQYIRMGQKLYETNLIFRQTLDQCEQILRPYLKQSLLSVIFSETNDLHKTAYTQPALFSLEYALAQFWISLGVKPSVVLGHSVGEYVAACLAGVFSLEDGLKLIATRGKLMQVLPKNGGMVAVFADEETVRSLIKEDATIAAFNTPNTLVISGTLQNLSNIIEKCNSQGIKTTPLNVSHGFHSPLMTPMLEEFRKIAAEITYHQPQIPLISNVTGISIHQDIATPEYWCEHIIKPVRFADSISTLKQLDTKIWLEIGPQPVLLGMARSCGSDLNQSLLPSLRPEQELQQFLSSLSELYFQGISINWAKLDPDYIPNLIQLPTYPFQRQSYWWSTAKFNPQKSFPISNSSHPLLGEKLQLAGTTEIRFQSRLSSQSPHYLQDHCLFSQPVLPATAYLEIILAAIKEIRENVTLSQLTIEQPLKLSTAETTVQVILTPQSQGEYEFKIYSFIAEENIPLTETLHARGSLTQTNLENRQLRNNSLQREGGELVSISHYYEQVKKQGFNYGKSFQAIAKLWQKEDQALGLIQLPEGLRTETDSYTLHPVLLDACFQVLGAILLKKSDRTTYLPVSIENLYIYQQPSDKVWSSVKIKTIHSQQITAQLQLFDDNKTLLAEIETLTLRAINRKSLQELIQISDSSSPELPDLYRLTWKSKPRLSASQTRKTANWLIVSDCPEFGVKLAKSLEEKGDRCSIIHPENVSGKLQPCDQIIYLWSSNQTFDETGASLLNLVQRITQRSGITPPRLWIVTYSSPLSKQTKNYAFGLAKVIRLEHPNLACICIDFESLNLILPAKQKTLKPNDSLNQNFQTLLEELENPDEENQIVYREGVRYVPRLNAYQPDSKTQQSYQLKIANLGTLDHFDFIPLTRKKPGFGEVEIQVRAVGLNFRDVLNGLGMLNQYLEQMGISNASKIPLGGECSGIIVAVGAGVKDLNIGDEVIAAPALGCLGSYITVNHQFVIPKPTHINFAEAATLSTAFLTAYYALIVQAQLKPGDRILIHAASGGVGQAAIQIAQQIGAEIYATASPGKQEFLKSIGIKFVMNSRTLAFADKICELTNNQGVEVVLNSLNGEFIPKSLEILSPNGRFIEIGKIGIWTQQQVQEKRADITYKAFDLLEIAEQTPQLIKQMLTKLMPGFEEKQLQPLPYTVFPVEEAANAFRYMAQAKHIGKVVMTLPPPIQDITIREDSTYLITGGLGALGLQVAQWLVTKQAKNLLLVGRSEPSQHAKNVIEKLKNQGVTIQVIKADITDLEAVETVIKPYTISNQLPPLRGIIHAAGVLNDGILEKQTWERFREVFAPKVTGTLNLHTVTLNLPLDFFVCFSSITVLIGSPGQSNYVAANSIMDGLMEYRHQLGLPGLSINWGAWDEAGMAAQLSNQNQGRLLAQGMKVIAPQQGLKVLDQLLSKTIPQIGVFSVDWSAFIQQVPDSVAFPFLENLISQDKAIEPEVNSNPKLDFLRQLATASTSDRKTMLLEKIRSELATVLGYSSPESINLEDNLSDLGMDSLMAVEFKNRLQNCLGSTFSLSSVFDYPDLEALVNYFLTDVLTEEILNQSLNTRRIVTPTPPSQPLTPPPPTPELIEEVIPAEYYQFERFPEYLTLERDIKKAEKLGNPFFRIYDGVARETIQVEGRELINYASYNYLGLCGDPQVSELAKTAIEDYGTSVSASRIVAGERSLHQELEQEIAQFLGTEDCIVYIGGHATNVSTIGHLFGEKDLILYDALSHNSIRQGCLLSGSTAIEFPHNNWQSLEKLLQQKRRQFEKVLIVIEGIYSTEGDIAPLPEIVALKKQYKTFLMVDEAHSIGVLGQQGRGISEYFKIPASDVDLWMGTLSKSFASCGGYIAGSQQLIKYLKYTAPGFVFSVGMSPPNTAAALAALRILQKEPQRVRHLCDGAQRFLTLAKQQGLNTGISQNSPIIPIIVGESQKAVTLSQALFKRGINVYPIVYPSVPYNSARLRFFMTATHTEAQIEFTIKTLVEEIQK